MAGIKEKEEKRMIQVIELTEKPMFWAQAKKKIPEEGTIYYLLKYAVSSFESEKCEVIYLNHNSLMQYPKSHMSVVQTPGPH